MLNTLNIFEELTPSMGEAAARKLAGVLGAVYEDLQNTVTKQEFAGLREVVGELAQAQQRTEQRLEELVQAQQRTEQRVEELAQAQQRTEQRLQELTAVVAETRTELKQTRRDLGGLTHTVGYQLEDLAYRALPALLLRDHGVEVTVRLVRRHLPLKATGRTVEVNILGAAVREGRKVHVVGESKSQLHRRDFKEFMRRKLPLLQAELGEVIPVLITYMTPEPGLEEEIRQQGVALYYSYDLASSPEPSPATA